MGRALGKVLAEQNRKPAGYGNDPVFPSFSLNDVDRHFAAIAVVDPSSRTDAPDAHVFEPQIGDFLPPQTREQHQCDECGIPVSLERKRVFQFLRGGNEFFRLLQGERFRQGLGKARQLNADRRIRFDDIPFLQITE